MLTVFTISFFFFFEIMKTCNAFLPRSRGGNCAASGPSARTAPAPGPQRPPRVAPLPPPGGRGGKCGTGCPRAGRGRAVPGAVPRGGLWHGGAGTGCVPVAGCPPRPQPRRGCFCGGVVWSVRRSCLSVCLSVRRAAAGAAGRLAGKGTARWNWAGAVHLFPCLGSVSRPPTNYDGLISGS